MTLVRDHVSQDASGWTKTGVTMTDGFFSLKINTVVGTNLHYAWDHSGSLTLPSSGRCTLSITISSADVPRIAIGTHPSDTTRELSAIFDLRNHTFAGWHGSGSTQNTNSATITRSGSSWVLTANIDFGASYGGRAAVMHVWLLDASTPPRQSWAAANTDGVSIQGLSMVEWAGGSSGGSGSGGSTSGSGSTSGGSSGGGSTGGSTSGSTSGGSSSSGSGGGSSGGSTSGGSAGGSGSGSSSGSGSTSGGSSGSWPSSSGGSGGNVTTLPTARSFTGQSVTEGGFKSSMTQLIDYLSSSLGTSSGAGNVLTHLGTALSGHRRISGSTTLTSADRGRIVESAVSSSISVTLPPISDVGDGYTVMIVARSGNVTVRAYDAIYGNRESTLPAGRAALVFAEKSAGTWGAVSLDAGLSQSVSTYVDSGQIGHGDQLPKPAGYTWDDCEWVVTIEDPTCGYRDDPGVPLQSPASRITVKHAKVLVDTDHRVQIDIQLYRAKEFSTRIDGTMVRWWGGGEEFTPASNTKKARYMLIAQK